MNAQAPEFLLLGFLGLFMPNRFLNVYLVETDASADYTLGLIPMLGIGLHSLIDGVIYGVLIIWLKR